MKNSWKNKNITILGLSKSGICAAKYLAKQGAKCLISEKRAESVQDESVIAELKNLGIEVEMGDHSIEAIKGSSLIVRSPGIPP